MNMCSKICFATLISTVLADGEPMLEAKALVTGSEAIDGTVMLKQEPGSDVEIIASFTGLPEGKHGFHIHEDAPGEDGCESTGHHYNPAGLEHGGPGNPERHAGDFGNIEANAEGSAELSLSDNIV